ncbi:MAG: hypothetical protein JJU29_23425 [Verrucomicrobia bacterium]|nr:hypothetical protein [Verrucomicrobiota bacterium]MCH8514431.1 hypothetical protein [Kiritimatiellia bacterium]
MEPSETEALLTGLDFLQTVEFSTPPPETAFFQQRFDEVNPMEGFDFHYLEAQGHLRDWDKCLIYGVGVSPDRSRVVFFVESW